MPRAIEFGLQQIDAAARHVRVVIASVDEVPGWPADLVALYLDAYGGLVRLSASMLGSTAEAEEVVQDAVVALHRHWARVDAPGAYLRRAVVNGSIGVLRRRMPSGPLRIDDPPIDAPREFVELRDVLLRLPARQRAAIVLRFVAGLDDDDIANDLGVRRSTVRSLIARGLASIRQDLQGDHDE